ncbi:MAG TPA: serine/threonine-protein kinase, partial [Planctomycetota bacterium]|nr:serine/threonine-protein kinase [Planctomycetota bacterium]
MFHKHPLIGKTIADDYKILSILGRGGMGTVFVAEQISMNRQVALKLMPTFDLSSEEAQRFEAEIAAMANICHPNIVAIHQRGKFDDSSSPTLYYSMELLEGGSLKQYLHDYGKLPPNVAIRHVKQIADALAYLHESGWIHRDIKPDNLLFNRNYRSLKIADFGIARLEKSVHITQSQSMVGTFLYSSPEQMKWYEKDRDPDYDIDGRTDQYSLGIVFYEMITGKLPFEATNLIEMVKTIDKPPIPISKYISNIPNSLEWLLNRMMEKKRDNRFATDDELLEAIANVEIEMATTNSSRIYAVKADDDSKPATNRNLLFDEEKLRISNMPTIHTDIQALTKKTYMRMFIVFSVVFVTVFLISILFFKSKNKPVQQPKPPVTVPKINNNAQIQVNINIVPTFDPDLSSKNPSHYQLLFISQTDNQTYQSPKTLRPDTYKIVIILEGYTSPQNSKYVHIPAQKAYMIPIHFTAIARKISSTIQNIGGSPEMPLYYKIGDTVIDSDNIQIKPGKYKLHATFSQYQEINQEIMIEPSTKPYQYQTYLRPWENMPLHFSIPTYDFEKSDNLEIHIDDQVVSKELIEYVVQDQMIHIKVKYPNDAKNLTVYWGCYTNHSP